MLPVSVANIVIRMSTYHKHHFFSSLSNKINVNNIQSIGKYLQQQKASWACWMGLSQRGVNHTDKFGGTPLLAACVLGVTDAAKLLLEHGAQVDQSDGEGYTPLWCASYLGESACVEILIEFGAEQNPDKGPNSPLHAAVCAGQSTCVQLLLKSGSHVNSRHSTDHFATPLHDACRSRLLKPPGYFSRFIPLQRLHTSFNIIAMLIESGAEVNAIDDEGNSPLHYLCRHVPETVLVDCVLFLLSYGANMALKNHHGQTPRMLSECPESLKTAESLCPLPSLQSMCIFRIRRSMKCSNIEQGISSLPLPKKLQKQLRSPIGKGPTRASAHQRLTPREY